MGNYKQADVWIQWKFLYKEGQRLIKPWMTGGFELSGDNKFRKDDNKYIRRLGI